jgi:hypothetical protein
MARQGDRVQLEQSDMLLELNMAKMTKEGFSNAAINETKYLIKTPGAKVREETKWGVESPGHKTLKIVIQRHPAMLRQNHTSGCLPCQNGTTKNPQSCWRLRGTGAPPPDQCREPTPEPTPLLPGMPPAPTGNTSRAQCSQIVNLQVGYSDSHRAVPCGEFYDDDKNTRYDTNFDPDMLTDEH